MTVEFIGFTLDVIGKVMVAFTAIMVHHRVWKEHEISSRVFSEMKREQFIGVAGILLIVVGYLLQASEKLGW